MSKQSKTSKLPSGKYSKGQSGTNPYGKNPSSQMEFITNILELPGNAPRKRKHS